MGPLGAMTGADCLSVEMQFYHVQANISPVEKIIKQYSVDKVSAILEFVQCESDIDYLVFGVERKEQLQENILKGNETNVPRECLEELKKQINNVTESIIFPSLWSNGRKAE